MIFFIFFLIFLGFHYQWIASLGHKLLNAVCSLYYPASLSAVALDVIKIDSDVLYTFLWWQWCFRYFFVGRGSNCIPLHSLGASWLINSFVTLWNSLRASLLEDLFIHFIWKLYVACRDSSIFSVSCLWF